LLLLAPPGHVSDRNARGVSPFRGFPSQGAALPHRKHNALLTFFPARSLQPWSEGGGRPFPRHLGFREGPFSRLQGLPLPKSPFTPAHAFRCCQWPVPSWAFSSLGSAPPRRCNGFRRRSSHLLQPASLTKASSHEIRQPAVQSLTLRRGHLPSEEGARPF
jgi:hypothetical protein